MLMFKKSNLLLFAASRLFTRVLGQNSSCQGYQRGSGTVNSTGQHEFTWNSSYATNDPWYVSVLVGSRGAEWNDYHDVKADTYISVPENVPNETKICLYQYTNINATLESGGENSCDGVISSACVDHLTEALNQSASGCPSSDTGTTLEAFNKACPMLQGISAQSSKFIDVTNSTCAYSDLPEVQIPDKYNTFGTVMGLNGFNTISADADANQAYNILTRQTIPLVLLGRFVESNRVQSSIEFVCMNANRTVEGSRVPEEEKPWESTGPRLSAKTIGWLPAVVTAAMLTF